VGGKVGTWGRSVDIVYNRNGKKRMARVVDVIPGANDILLNTQAGAFGYTACLEDAKTLVVDPIVGFATLLAAALFDFTLNIFYKIGTGVMCTNAYAPPWLVLLITALLYFAAVSKTVSYAVSAVRAMRYLRKKAD
jgi:hypothetical protein